MLPASRPDPSNLTELVSDHDKRSKRYRGHTVAAGLGGLIRGWMIHSRDGSEMKAPAHPALATDTVRYVGDHVAAVVAETSPSLAMVDTPDALYGAAIRLTSQR